ncbi:MAG: GTPase HflX [Candidatus Cloacimonetes bacterium]|nr:GTPase HflX [Candidatus Cloacimonadota bacterium]
MKHEYDELDFLEHELEDWEELEKPVNTAFLAALVRQGESPQEAQASLSELERLADTAGITVLGSYTQKRNNPERGSFFGKGFLEEMQTKMLKAGAELLVVNEELSPIQARNIDQKNKITVVDRTELILSIFHNHAKTREAKFQIKLAELEYQLPRLRRLWGHFDKERGSVRSVGGAATRGMGEKQIEIDKRLIRNQIRRCKKALNEIMHQKETQRKQRENTKKICLVGYTNAGKSTLFNALTNAGVLVEDKLFATLDSTSRQLKLETGSPIVISDTVGFISNLPHHLVASFRATLMEVKDANLLLHIVDASDERYEYYISQVQKVLEEIEASHIPQLIVLNKIDRLEQSFRVLIGRRYEYSVMISALQQDNIGTLLERIDRLLFQSGIRKILLPYDKGSIKSRLHEIGSIKKEEYRENGIYLEVSIDEEHSYLIRDYEIV